MLQWQRVFFGPLVWSPTAPKAFSPFPYVACANVKNQTSAQRDRSCCWTVFFSSGHLPSSQPSDETAGTLTARLWTMSSPSGSHSQCNPSSSWAEEAEKTNNGACEKKTTVCAGWCFPMSSPCVSSMVGSPPSGSPSPTRTPPLPPSPGAPICWASASFSIDTFITVGHIQKIVFLVVVLKGDMKTVENTKHPCSLSLWFWVLHNLVEKTYRSSLVPIERMEVQPRGRTLS